MARLLQHIVEEPRPCSYLPGERASLEHKVMLGVDEAQYEEMLARGWRRFGPAYFRPACAPCGACVSLRVPVQGFHPTRSQRRAYKRCASFRRVEGPPRIDAERLALYDRWHAFREDVREWPSDKMDPRSYFEQFAFPHPAAREVAWYDDDAPGGPRLVAVSLRDQTPHTLSLVYFFYEPELASRSPGVANIVQSIEDAGARDIPHVYLGYRVEACASLRYKGNYGPHELLTQRPSETESPTWSAAAATPAEPEPEDEDEESVP